MSWHAAKRQIAPELDLETVVHRRNASGEPQALRGISADRRFPQVGKTGLATNAPSPARAVIPERLNPADQCT